MSNQAQVDAIEHLLMAVLKSSGMTMNSFKAFEKAQGSLMGSDGPGGPEQKSAAAQYLDHLKKQL
ncbi:hypothetical protein [Pseudomonas sp. NY15374]|uniref:hypothetical protein n=1 Tax=Pseudomonas sp. NY15374 TaxID=3400357 RepID=UPI003A850D8B